ncbi:F-box/LRR-repeat protein At3g59190-like [Salvia miltiorrhiza]|uniref:F-box/LRR-repeat protein At3g59190-like n=1 Tax=Salvia miltiorrhiza TaxID=226208 RepID=UPI0025AC812D|nr:F-box/LRR-repeat protein At3g59190-like [Salvia miltiorrhiza]
MENPQKRIAGESQLPEEIIQHIQSLLHEEEEAARTSLLSKSWHGAWCTRPNLSFDQYMFWNRVDEFPVFTKKTMRRYEDLNLKIKSFRLTMMEEYEDHSLARELILKAIELGATDLTIEIPSLDGIVLESETLARLSVFGSIARPLHFDVGAITKLHKLEYLRLEGLDIKHSLSKNELWPQFRCLKDLVIVDYNSDYDWDDVRICSPSLERVIILFHECRNVSAEFDVPNIRYFKFEGHEMPRLKFKAIGSREWESDIHIRFSPYMASTAWLSSLNQFVKMLSSSRVSLFMWWDLLDDGHALSMPVVDNLRPEMPFLDALLWSCRPNFVNVQRRFYGDSEGGSVETIEDGVILRWCKGS